MSEDTHAGGAAPGGPTADDYQQMVRIALGDMPLKPRDYQAEAFVRIGQTFEDLVPSTLLVLPTGCGKTVTFLMVAKYEIETLGGRVLILAHRGELLTQAANAAAAVGLMAAMEKADEHARPDFTLGQDAPAARGGDLHATLFGDPDDPTEIDVAGDDGDPKLVIASVQTLQGKRLKAWPPGHFSLVICDEAHHAKAESYQKIIRHLEPQRYLGVTATWDRGDKQPLCGAGQVFESLAFEYTLTDAVESGYLSRPVFVCLDTAVDLGSIRTTGGDLNAGDLEAAITPHIEELVNEVKPHLEGKKFIVFTPDVGSADAVASAFQALGVSCQSVSGACKDRDDVIAEYKSGRLRGIANCALLTEGFDDPATDAIVMMRPTKSRALFTQMVGRGTRLSPGKAECTVFGYNWKTFKHKLVHPVELFHTEKIDRETTDAAKGLVDSGQEKDLLTAMKRAASEKAERERLKIQARERKAKAKAYRFDPLSYDPAFVPEAHSEAEGATWEAKATDRQVEALMKSGFGPEVAEWSRARASGAMSRLADRRNRGLSSYKQCKFLKRLGCPDGSKLTFEQASAEIEARMNKGKASA